MDGALSFIDFDKLDLKELKTALTFEDGLVKVKPFTIKYQDIAINVAGSHTFDQKLNYTATFEVPAKYLGKDISNLIAKIDDKSLEGLTIPVTANIGGLYTSPTVSTDLTSGVKNLTSKLVEIEKQKLLNQGKDKAKNLIGGLLGGDAKTKDSTSQKTTGQEGVKEVLGGLLGTKPKTKDTTGVNTNTTTPKKDPIKEAASGVLGGFLNKKKKDAEVKKDSVN